MVRYRKKRPFYEAMTKPYHKPGYEKDLEKLHPDSKTGEIMTETDRSEAAAGLTRWPRRPSAVQFNAGRIEISIPYQVGVAALLGVILLVLVAFRLGQASRRSEATSIEPKAEVTSDTSQVSQPTATTKAQRPAGTEAVTTKAQSAVVSKGNNRIVIQIHSRRADLEPVKKYFAGFGIETQIRQINRRYYLVTKGKYDNPEKTGTDGYAAKQRIIELGANYKAPVGYGSFGPKPFHDAFGMRFDD